MPPMCHWEGSLAANREAGNIGISLADAAGTNVSRVNELESVTRAIHFSVYAAARLEAAAEAAELAEVGRARWLDEAIQLATIRAYPFLMRQRSQWMRPKPPF